MVQVFWVVQIPKFLNLTSATDFADQGRYPTPFQSIDGAGVVHFYILNQAKTETKTMSLAHTFL